MKYVISLALVMSLAQLGVAATIHVPSEQPTIQAGIDAAVDGDTVLVEPGSYSENLMVPLKGIVLLSESGRDATTLSPAGPGRILTYTDQTLSENTVQGFTFTDLQSGSCIWIWNCARIHVLDNRFIDNSVTDGAVQVVYGDCTIRNNEFIGNIASAHGGGIRIVSDATSVIEANSFIGNSASHGGGVDALVSGPATIRYNLFLNNTCNGYGGAIYLGDSDGILVHNNTIDSCTSLSSTGGGIAFWVCRNDTAYNNIVVNCQGYGIWQSSSSGYQVDYNDCVNCVPSDYLAITPGPGSISADPEFVGGEPFDYNLQSSSLCIDAGNPDPIYNDPDGTRNDMGVLPYEPECRGWVLHVPSVYGTIQEALDSALRCDTVLVECGTYYEHGLMMKTEVILLSEGGDANCATIDANALGRILYCGDLDTATTIRGFTLADGNTETGAGMFCDSGCQMVIENCFFQANNCTEGSDLQGAALYGIDCSLTLSRCEFADNTALGSYGAALYFENSDLTFDSCSWQQNEYFGLHASGGTIELSECTFFDGNQGIIVWGSTLEATNCTFENNLNRALVSTGATTTFMDCLFSGNGNGALSSITSRLTVSGCDFVNNSSGGWGGAISWIPEVSMTAFCTIANSRFLGNSAERGGGVLVDGAYRPASITDCTFANNVATTGSAVACGLDCDVGISNSIMSFGLGGDAVACFVNPERLSLTCCDLYGNAGGDWVGCVADQEGLNGNLSADPLFCDTAGQDYYLMDISPCAPANNSCSTLIGADTVGCLVIPEVLNLALPEEPDPVHVLSHTPEINWQFFDPVAGLQLHFEIAVSTDDDWEYAEMWNPAPFESGDTSVVYAGATLEDGEWYWLRLRVNNGYAWSDWFEIAFGMNSTPTTPSLDSPTDGFSVVTLYPTFIVHNSSDPEGDTLAYLFEISPDSFLVTTYSFEAPGGQGGTTEITVDIALEENSKYWWRAKASDYYEESEYSDIWTFYVDSENSLPSGFQLAIPPDTSGAAVEILTPEFLWTSSFDSDPLDSVLYTLLLSIDSSFSFVNEFSEINVPSYTLTEDLSWGTRYWWKVRADDTHDGETWSDNVLDFRTVTLGDANGDGTTNVTDAVYLITYIFSGGPEPVPLWSGDADCDGTVNITDAVYLIQYIFAGGPPPCETG